MNDEELLQALAQCSRDEVSAERSRFDRRWDGLSAGELTTDEERELQELAASSPEHAQALEAFYPLDEEFRARTVSLLQARTGSGLPQQEEKDTEGMTSRQRWPWTKIRIGWLLPAAALAALLVLAVLPLGTPQPLPEYTAELRGGLKELRGSKTRVPGELPVLVEGSSFDVVLRPRSAVDGSLVVRCLLVHEGVVHERTLPAEVAESGAVRIAARLGRDLDLEPGVWSLVTVVAHRRFEPTPAQLEAVARQAQPRRAEHWVVSRVSFQVRDEPFDDAPAGS